MCAAARSRRVDVKVLAYATTSAVTTPGSTPILANAKGTGSTELREGAPPSETAQGACLKPAEPDLLANARLLTHHNPSEPEQAHWFQTCLPSIDSVSVNDALV